MAIVKWEKKKFKDFIVFRTRIPGGWLVWINNRRTCGINFYHDPMHRWDMSCDTLNRMAK